MAKNKKRSFAAKKSWAKRHRAKAAAAEITSNHKLLDGPLLEINAERINPELGPAAVGTPQLNLRDTVAELDKLLGRLYSLLG